MNSFDGSLTNLAKVINRIVDFDECTTESRFVVKAGVDKQLDALKRTYLGLDDFLVPFHPQKKERRKQQKV